jgi:hypothetical protein
MRIPTRLSLLILAVALTGLASGCAAVGVKVWQRDILAKPEMQMDAQGNDQEIDDHIYFSKEDASGGRGFGGGGCGCN